MSTTGGTTSSTTTSATTNIVGDLDTATQRIRDLTEEVIAQAKRNGLAFLEGYERVLQNLLDLEEQAARGTGQEWATTLASTHANFVRETSEMFLSMWRSQLKG